LGYFSIKPKQSPMMQSNLPAPRWGMPKRIGMLTLAAYLFFLFFDFTSSDEIFPGFIYTLVKPYVNFWNWLVPWTGSHILHLSYPITITPNGSGDTTYNYVMQLLWVVLALVTGIVWAVADRKRNSYKQLYYWVRIFTRYYFAYTLFIYGSLKIIKLQFPFPSLLRLTEPYGDSSPMALAWTFIGYSKGYNYFTGSAEVLALLLLFFRRTSLLGSLVALTIMVNIAAMNMAYDIPVKIFSLNLVCLAVFLAAHDFDRLKSIFFLHTAALPPHPDPRPKTRRNIIIQRALKGIYIFLTVYFTFWRAIKDSDQYGDAAPRPPLYGIYDVETFVQQGVAVPPLATDSTRWKRMIIPYEKYARVTTMPDSVKRMTITIDTTKKSLEFVPQKAPADSFLLRYNEPDKDHLLLTGAIGRDSVRILMKRFDLNKFKLVNRDFHWINEYPFNR